MLGFVFIAACGKGVGSTGDTLRSDSNLRGTWHLVSGPLAGNVSSATIEFGEDFVQLNGYCGNYRGTVFSPTEFRANSFVVKETHASTPPCVMLLTKGEKPIKFSGDSLILDGVVGSSRWKR